jgi:TolB protein
MTSRQCLISTVGCLVAASTSILMDGNALAAPLTLPYQLTHTLNYAAAPSPDGKQLVTITVIAGKGQIFIMNVNGSGLKQITHDEVDYDDPIFSPDGNWILVTGVSDAHERIYLMHPDGTGVEPLTPEEIHAIHGTWSPDNEQVIFCADDDLKPPQKNEARVFSIDLKTRRMTTLITGGINTYPSFSPDMKHIVWRKIVGDMNSEVFVANADGSNPRNITNSPAFDGWPAWSPNGKKIAFASNRGANYQVYLMDPSGENVQLVANTDGRATSPRWAFDGKTIYFTNCKNVDYGVSCEIMVSRLAN